MVGQSQEMHFTGALTQLVGESALCRIYVICLLWVFPLVLATRVTQCRSRRGAGNPEFPVSFPCEGDLLDFSRSHFYSHAAVIAPFLGPGTSVGRRVGRDSWQLRQWVPVPHVLSATGVWREGIGRFRPATGTRTSLSTAAAHLRRGPGRFTLCTKLSSGGRHVRTEFFGISLDLCNMRRAPGRVLCL